MKNFKNGICTALAALLAAIMLFSGCDKSDDKNKSTTTQKSDTSTTTTTTAKGDNSTPDNDKDPPSSPVDGEITLAQLFAQYPQLLLGVTELKSAEIICSTNEKEYGISGNLRHDLEQEYSYVYAQNSDGQSEFLESRTENGKKITTYYPVYGMYNCSSYEGIVYDTESGKCYRDYGAELGKRDNFESLLNSVSSFYSAKETIQKQGAELIKCKVQSENGKITLTISITDPDIFTKAFGIPASYMAQIKNISLSCTAVFDANGNLCSLAEKAEAESKRGEKSFSENKMTVSKHNSASLAVPECVKTWVSDIKNIVEFSDWDETLGEVWYIRTLSTDTRAEYDIYTPAKQLVATEYDTFNKHGDLLVTERKKLDGTTLFKEEHTHNYEYDNNGNITKHVHIFEGEELERIDYAYNAVGNVIKESNYYGGRLYGVQEFNDNGNVIKQMSYDENGVETERYEMTYNEMGLPLKQTMFENGKEVGHMQASYDENGNMTKLVTVQDGVEVSKTEYEYNNNGYILKETRYENGKEVASELYEYHENGEEKKFSRYEEGVLTSLSEYNENGDIIKDMYLYDDGEYLNVYEYDKDGNRIKSTAYFNGVITSLEEYNKNGDTVKYIRYTDGKEEYCEEYEYNADGVCIKNVCYENGVLYSIHEYNDNEDPLKIVYYHTDGTEDSRHEYEYNAKGELLKCTSYNDGKLDCEELYNLDGGKLYYTGYYYDENGKIYNATEYGFDNSMLKDTFYNPNGTVNSVREFDDNENVVLQIEYSYSGQTEMIRNEYYYDFDEDGNFEGYTLKVYRMNVLKEVSVYDENHDLVSKETY